MQLNSLSEEGLFSPLRIADALKTHQKEIASTLGLSEDAVSRKARIRSKTTQKRLREMVEILNRVERGIGSPILAYAWFRSEPLPGFAGRTANHLVREGKAQYVHTYLDHVNAGVYA